MGVGGGGDWRMVSDAITLSMQALFVALRLWHLLPEDLAASCHLLPPGAPAPPAGFWSDPLSVTRQQVECSAAELLSPRHCAALRHALLLASASYPRLHGAWACVLALLLPGFRPVKVTTTQAGPPAVMAASLC